MIEAWQPPRGSPLPVLVLALGASLAVSADSAPAPLPQGASQAPGARSIRGQVTDAAGQPIPGATVRLLLQGLSALEREMRFDSWLDPLVLRTDDKGLFETAGLTGTAFVVRVESPGSAAETVLGIPPGAWLSLRLRRGHELRGVVAEAVRGRRVAGATLLACDDPGLAFGFEACAEARSGEDGTFAFASLPTGIVRLRAQGSGYAVSRVEAVPLPLAAGAPPPTLTLRPGSRVAGRVVDERGEPVAGARVWGRPAAGSFDDLAESAREWPTHTGGDGRFVLAGVPAGEAWTPFAFRADRDVGRGAPLDIAAGAEVPEVEILLPAPPILALSFLDSAGGQPPRQVELLCFREPAAADRAFAKCVEPGRIQDEGGGRFTVRFPESGTRDLLIAPEGFSEVRRDGVVLEPGRRLDLGALPVQAGLAIAGRVTDPQAEPVPGATVEASWDADGWRRSRRVATDASGQFRAAGLGQSPVTLSASAPGFETASLAPVQPGATDLALVLARLGALAGRVRLEEGGAPEAFVIVTHREAESVPATGALGFPREDPFSTGDGSYRIDALPPGRYTVEARAPGRVAARRSDVRVDRGQLAEVPTIELGEGLAVAGRVLSAGDETPILGAEVSARPQELGPAGSPAQGRQAAASGDDGRFRIGGLAAGPYWVRARHAEFAPAEQRVEIGEEEDSAGIVFMLSRGGSLSGTARDGAGDPAAGRRILISSGLVGHEVSFATTDRAGRYELDRLPPGSYVATLLRADGSALGAVRGNVVIREGEVALLDLVESAPITLTGTVYRDGEPVGGAWMFFSKTVNLSDFKSSKSDASGRYEVGLDEPGNYRVLLTLTDGTGAGSSSAEIAVADEPFPVRDIHLGGDGVSGTVSDEDGRALSGAVVAATPEGGDSPERAALLVAESGADGRYSIGLGPGVYRLTATAPGFEVGIVQPVTLDGRGVTVDFRLEAGGELRGRLLDELGRGIAGAAVLVAPAGSTDSWGTGASTCPTDINGAFRVTLPGAGALDVTAIAGGWAAVRLLGVVPGASSEELILRAGRGGALHIRAGDASGLPRAGVVPAVRAIPAFLGSDLVRLIAPPAPTDGAGLTVLEHLAPGLYEVSIPGYATAPRQARVEEGSPTLVGIELP